ncbi:MAG: FAD-dependent thymidylate synthase [Candidatus Andersenbacteria bacterium]|nr:FAD-dependent thymidylate synthase [Candidatus Andersenbacteria bacterium]
MNPILPLEAFTPPYDADSYNEEQKWNLSPFFTNLTSSVYVPLISSPEVIGALCSRTSRAADDLRLIFLKEYVEPFLQDNPSDTEQAKYGKTLKEFIDFLHTHPTESIFSNPKARSFYAKWLAQYGDDSIAQMAGMHVVFSSLSQIAIKQFEDQRIGLAPIEKSTRYVDYSQKVHGGYRYYTDPTLKQLGLEEEYTSAMNTLFDTYIDLIPKLSAYLAQQFPDETKSVVEKKAFDTVRGLLPMATLSQVAFFGNGQAFEYLVSRSARHSLGEIRWATEQTYQELYKVTPSFLRRVKDPASQDKVEAYQDYLSQKTARIAKFVPETLTKNHDHDTAVSLVEYDVDGEAKIIAGMLYNADSNTASWEDTLAAVQAMSEQEKREILAAYLGNRTQRWQKVGRAFENTYLRYDITIDIGAWRDLHRHRMLTQQRQLFTVAHGHETPQELIDAGLDQPYRDALHKAAAIYRKIAEHDPILAQYAVPMAYKVRFMQWTNVRECFWEMELRTIPEGHPGYRHIEQEKFRLFEKVYPLIAQYMRVNMGEYDFARRGQEEKIQEKLKALEKLSA